MNECKKMAERKEQVIVQVVRAAPDDLYSKISVAIFCSHRIQVVIRVSHLQTRDIYIMASWSLLAGSNIATFHFSKTPQDGTYRIDVLQSAKRLSYMDFEKGASNSTPEIR